jgi:methyl coenzyme M reductase subunit D
MNYEEKLRWLHSHNVILKDKKPSKASVDRLFSFYQKNPLSTPIEFAYGMKKRVKKTIDIKGKDYKLQTPEGKVSAKDYIKTREKQKEDLVKKKIDFNTSFVSGRYKKYMKRVQDYLVYRYDITANEANISKVLRDIERNVIPVIKRDITIVYRNYREFYEDILVGAIISFKSSDFPQGEGTQHRRVGFVHLYKSNYKEYIDFFLEHLFENIKEGLLLVRQYNNFAITLKKIEIVFTSDLKASEYEKLRI